MQRVVTLALVAFLCAECASAQDNSKKLVKVIIGGSALVIGTTIAAKSSQTTTVSTPVGQTETSSYSSSQLATGLVIAGAGGIVLWSGLREHRPSPSVSAGIATGPQGHEVFIRRSW
jgi:hypothetical protein